jgi:hypothetical protein
MTLKRIPKGEWKMGLTHVPVKIGRLGSNKLFDAMFLVDTGATDAMAPASELSRVGIEPAGKRTYSPAVDFKNMSTAWQLSALWVKSLQPISSSVLRVLSRS